MNKNYCHVSAQEKKNRFRTSDENDKVLAHGMDSKLQGQGGPEMALFFDNQDEWLTSAEAAKYLKITEASLRNMVCYGKLHCYKLGRRNRYLKTDLRSLLTKKIGGS